MFRTIAHGRKLSALVLALCLVLTSASSVFAHARFDRAEPPLDVPLDGTPVVLKAYFTQELTSKSTLQVLDENGVQVDFGDGHVDLDDPIRKTMLVTLPELPVGVYTIDFVAESAEDGHGEPGTVRFGVGMLPPAVEETEGTPAVSPAADPATYPVTESEADPTGQSMDMVRAVAY